MKTRKSVLEVPLYTTQESIAETRITGNELLYFMSPAGIRNLEGRSRETQLKKSADRVRRLGKALLDMYGQAPRVEIFATETPHCSETAINAAEVLGELKLNAKLHKFQDDETNPSGRILSNNQLVQVMVSSAEFKTTTLLVADGDQISRFVPLMDHLPGFSTIVEISSRSVSTISEGYEY